MDNKALWDNVCTTDPRAVKPITGKAYQGNSPKPYWLIERATDVFGPVGIGWGCTVKSERFERLSDTDVLHVAVVSIWYVIDGKRSETFDQMGGTKAAYKTAKGSMMIDEDAGKKSVTDGMVKCLSMIGFAGDIFSGRWDDSKYVEHARQVYEDKDRDEDPERQAWLDTKRAEIMAAATMGDFKRIVAGAIAFASEQGDSRAVDQINTWADEKRAQAKPKVAA
jgi:hypothetical protein